jgi:hypothetical protein
MKITVKKTTVALLATGLFAFSSAAMATNGYFTHGVGTESKAMAGSGVGSSENMGAIAAATNPALAVFSDDKWQVGLSIFSPMRSYKVVGGLGGQQGTFTLSPGEYDSKNPAELPADYKYRSANKALERFRHELNVDMIDIVLLHCLVNPDWNAEMQPYMDALMEAKEKKQLRAVGVSCHNFGAMKTAVDTPWVDVILARLNPYEEKMDASVDEVVALLKKAKAKGKGVIGMKIFGAGTLLDKKDECMKFAQTNGVFDAMTIGATTPGQVDENLALMAKYPVV